MIGLAGVREYQLANVRVRTCALAAALQICTPIPMRGFAWAKLVRAGLRHQQHRTGAQPCILKSCCAVLCHTAK